MIQRKDAIIFLVENEETTTRMLNLWPVYSVISHEFTPFFVGRIQTISILDKPIVKSEHDTRKSICLSKLPWCSGVVCIHITPYIGKSTALAPSLLLCSSSLLLASSLQQALAVPRKSLLFSFRNESPNEESELLPKRTIQRMRIISARFCTRRWRGSVLDE
jgi:hypothetical protein